MSTPAARGDGRRKGVQRRVRFRRGAWIALPIYLIAFFVPSAPAARAESYTVTSASDYYITFSEPVLFLARTYMYEGSPDTHLWLYNPAGDLVAANDDYFWLQSFISYQVTEPGTYRLRTGVCCGDPERWYGGSYTLETSTAVSPGAPETTTTTTTTTIAPYLNPPTNLTAELLSDGSVRLSWTAPEQSNVEVESYAVLWSTGSFETGQAVSATDTSITLQGLQAGTSYTLHVRAENSALGLFSDFSGRAEISIPAPSTTTTTTATTVPAPPTTTPVAPETTVAPPPETTPPQATTTVPSTTTPPTLPPATTTTTTTTTSSVAPTTTEPTPATTTTTVFTPPASSEEAFAAIATADLSTVTSEEATEVFQALDVASLDDQEKKLLIDKLADAPSEVRAAFEEEIDIFGEGLDDYVPLGSSVDVGTRRALIAVTAVTTTLTVTTGMTPPPPPAPAPTSPTPTPPNDSSSATGEEKSSRRRRK